LKALKGTLRRSRGGEEKGKEETLPATRQQGTLVEKKKRKRGEEKKGLIRSQKKHSFPKSVVVSYVTQSTLRERKRKKGYGG